MWTKNLFHFTTKILATLQKIFIAITVFVFCNFSITTSRGFPWTPSKTDGLILLRKKNLCSGVCLSSAGACWDYWSLKHVVINLFHKNGTHVLVNYKLWCFSTNWNFLVNDVSKKFQINCVWFWDLSPPITISRPLFLF